MGNLLMRRRELILPSGGEPVGPLVYSLENRTVVDSEVIDTGVSPWLFENTTILFDMNITTNPTNTAQAYRYILMRIRNATNGTALILAKPSQWNNGCRVRIYDSRDNDDTAKILTSAAGRKRVVITHVSGSKTIHAWGKNGNSAATEKTPVTVNSADVAQDGTLAFGVTGTGYGLPPGTINLAQVYNVILPQEDIDAFLA